MAARTAVGTRVLAIEGAENGVVLCFGEGVYAGDDALPDYALGFNYGQMNPRIDLDSGQVVWGCECWWGPVEAMRARFGPEWE